MAFNRKRYIPFTLALEGLSLVAPSAALRDLERPTIGAVDDHRKLADGHEEDFKPLPIRVVTGAPSSATAPVHYTSGYRLDLSRWPPYAYLYLQPPSSSSVLTLD